MEAAESCINIIKTRPDCQARCPGCETKCDNTEINHTKHRSTHHLMKVFNGWHIYLTKEPNLYLCYQGWLTGPVIIKKETCLSNQDYFSKRNPEWFDDLELKSKTNDLHDDSKPPLEQRRAWMAVRYALVKRGSSKGVKDLKYYDKEIYPDIKSASADFTPVWD
jgi:hypothetical protein